MSLVPISEDDIDTLRSETYLRDLYDAGPPVVALSNYNVARKAVFIGDDALKAMAELVLREFYDQISGVYDSAHGLSRARGHSEVDANASAAAIQKDAFFALIRAAVLENMMIDPGFRGSIADETLRKDMFKKWDEQILRDRTFASSRTSSALRGIPIKVR